MSEKTALIRRCNSCGAMTAVDFENTPDHMKELALAGHTVSEATEDELVNACAEHRRCECGNPIKVPFPRKPAVPLFDGTPVKPFAIRRADLNNARNDTVVFAGEVVEIGDCECLKGDAGIVIKTSRASIRQFPLIRMCNRAVVTIQFMEGGVV